jgi:transposase-like protein
MEQKTKFEPRQKRTFSEAFKRQKVKDIIEKRVSIKDISSLYSVSRSAVYKWLYAYSPHHEQKTILVVQMESEATKTQMLQQRVAELERIIGQKQLELDFLNKLLEVGSEDLGFDLKKNLSIKLSNGSGGGEPKDKK